MINTFEYFETKKDIDIQQIAHTNIKLQKLYYIPKLDFEKLKSINNPIIKLNILLEYLVDIYDYYTDKNITNCESYTPFKEMVNLQKELLSKHNSIMDNNTKNKDTIYQEIEKIQYDIDKHNLFISGIKLFLYISLGLLILPILGIFNFLSKNTILLLWFFTVLSVSLYLTYKFYFKKSHRNNKFFDRFTFNNPTSEEVEKSKENISKEINKCLG